MTRRELLAFLAVLALAAGLRLYSIDTIPAGLWFDEAANGVDALHVLGGDRPIFFEGNQGREPFFIYLIALLFETLGAGTTQIRLASALVGIATVVVTYFLGRALLGRHAGLLAMLAIAVSYWHISLSRLGLRAGSLALFEALAILFLWQGLRSRRVGWFALSGLAVGGSLYTYLAGRVFPVWLGLFLVLVAVFPRLRPAFPLPRFILAAATLVLVAVVTFAPLGLYFQAHVDQFIGRAAAASAIGTGGQAGPPEQMVSDSVARTVGMFFIAGDLNPRHNLPGQPVFDPLQGAAFALGLATLALRWRRPESLLLFLWLFGGLLPGALAGEAPHFLRTSGLIPGLFVVEAVGLQIGGSLLAKFLLPSRAGLRHRIPLAAPILALLLAGGLAGYTYFLRWAPSAAAYYNFEADLLDSTRLVQQVPPEAPVLVSSTHTYRGSATPLNFASPLRPDVRVFNGRQSLLVPAATQGDVYYVIPRSFALDEDKLRLPFPRLLQEGDGQGGLSLS